MYLKRLVWCARRCEKIQILCAISGYNCRAAGHSDCFYWKSIDLTYLHRRVRYCASRRNFLPGFHVCPQFRHTTLIFLLPVALPTNPTDQLSRNLFNALPPKSVLHRLHATATALRTTHLFYHSKVPIAPIELLCGLPTIQLLFMLRI